MSRLARGVLVASAALLCAPVGASAATVAVNTQTDEFNTGSNCSLREAIQSVNNGADLAGNCTHTGTYGTSDTVSLPAGTYSLTINGPLDNGNLSGDLDASSDLTIAGIGNPTINYGFTGGAANDDRLIDVPIPGVDLTLNGLRLSGGKATQTADAKGGCVQFKGASPNLLTLDDVDVNACLASNTGGGQGGGIWSGGDVTIENSSSIGGGGANHAGQAMSSAGLGGGVYVEGSESDLTITDSEVKNNGAGDADGLTHEFGLGGGIYMIATGNSSLTLVDSAIDDNTAGHGTQSDDSFGGGIYVEGGGSNAADISGGTVSGNVAGGGANNAPGGGGGIYFAPDSGGLGLQLGAVVGGNKAGGNGGTGAGDGGGIYSKLNLDLLDSILSMNQAGVDTANAAGRGGGIFMPTALDPELGVQTSTIAGNQAGSGTDPGSGGGIFLDSEGKLAISQSLIDSNAANADSGGIRRDEADGGTSPADVITTSRITNNTAGPFPSGGAAGGMNFQTSGTLVIDRTTIDENAARGPAGTPSVAGGMLFASALDSETGSGLQGDLTIQNSTVFDNRASGGTAGGDGGGLVAVADGAHFPPDVTIFHSTFSNNQAVPGTSTGGDGGNWLFSGLDAGVVIVGVNIVTDGVGNAGAQNCKEDTAAIDSIGGNIEGPAIGPFPSGPTNQCEFGQAGDRQADPLLGPLADNGGLTVGDPTTDQPTMTMALLGGSPAIDLSPVGVCPASPAITEDERGLHRPAGAACDAGAYEAQDADGDGVVDPNDSCPGTPGPAFHAAGCPPPPPATTQPATTVNPLCAPLRKKLKKARKAGDQPKVKKLRGKLRKLGC